MSAPFDFDFRAWEPPSSLDRYVASLWYARGTIPYTREKIAPTGSTVAVIVLGDPILQTPDNGSGEALRVERGSLIGPHDRPMINEPTGETFAMGIVTTPVGCAAVFGVQPTEIRARVVDLFESWSPAAALRESLVAEAEPSAMLDRLTEAVAANLAPEVGGLERCERAVALVEADPTRSIADIADEVGVSHGHLVRELTRVVGLTPRVLGRLLRMRRLLAGIDVRDDVGWADLAADLGWFDQAHLIRDFKRHTGVTPTQYIAAQRSTYSPVEAEDAAGFVPE